jgi:hypothetical protein
MFKKSTIEYRTHLSLNYNDVYFTYFDWQIPFYLHLHSKNLNLHLLQVLKLLYSFTYSYIPKF